MVLKLVLEDVGKESIVKKLVFFKNNLYLWLSHLQALHHITPLSSPHRGRRNQGGGMEGGGGAGGGGREEVGDTSRTDCLADLMDLPKLRGSTGYTTINSCRQMFS